MWETEQRQVTEENGIRQIQRKIETDGGRQSPSVISVTLYLFHPFLSVSISFFFFSQSCFPHCFSVCRKITESFHSSSEASGGL